MLPHDQVPVFDVLDGHEPLVDYLQRELLQHVDHGAARVDLQEVFDVLCNLRAL